MDGPSRAEPTGRLCEARAQPRVMLGEALGINGAEIPRQLGSEVQQQVGAAQ